MPGKDADSGCCAMQMPPAALMACAPAVPFVPVPERMTATDFSFCSAASERKKSSTGRRCPRFSTGSPSFSVPSSSVSVWPGAMT